VARKESASGEFRAPVLVAMIASTTTGGLLSALTGWLVAREAVMRLLRLAEHISEVRPHSLSRRAPLPREWGEFGQLAAVLDGALDDFSLALRSQERFLSDVSHEFQTPLSAMLTEAQVLRASRASPEQLQNFALSVEDETRRLGKLIESFLMLTRLAHGRSFTGGTIVSLNDVVLESVRHAHMLAELQRVELQFSAYDPGDECGEGLVRADAELLRVAFDNIIRNALQYSPPSESVTVAVRCVDKHMVVTVRDRGPVIPARDIDRIFERFEQAAPRGSSERGTGLGLSIANQIVQVHGGTIQVVNLDRSGCEFEVRLDLATWPDVGVRPARA
jgi:signal transduction histidine kinase